MLGKRRGRGKEEVLYFNFSGRKRVSMGNIFIIKEGLFLLVSMVSVVRGIFISMSY